VGRPQRGQMCPRMCAGKKQGSSRASWSWLPSTRDRLCAPAHSFHSCSRQTGRGAKITGDLVRIPDALIVFAVGLTTILAYLSAIAAGLTNLSCQVEATWTRRCLSIHASPPPSLNQPALLSRHGPGADCCNVQPSSGGCDHPAVNSPGAIHQGDHPAVYPPPVAPGVPSRQTTETALPPAWPRPSAGGAHRGGQNSS
jgi:hypothetical protein